jgi:hypothetical protein
MTIVWQQNGNIESRTLWGLCLSSLYFRIQLETAAIARS